MNTLSLLILSVFALALGYLLLLAVASVQSGPTLRVEERRPSSRFIIVVPAHDEASVIQATVRQLRTLDYPADLYAIHVVADHCTDDTAELARQAGAFAHERDSGPRTGKGAALSWLFRRVLDDRCDAVVIFDADTRVATDFLRFMDARLMRGDQVIQGQHVIGNPERSWFTALTWAMFLVDNRFQNLGRSNLGWSAKHMGDSICFRADVLRRMGWGEGLTEDYQLRQRLLLEGIRIVYEPSAMGCGEAAPTLAQARAQRMRWLRGTRDASRQYVRHLLVEGIKHRNMTLLDGALQALLPSYSTLTMVGGFLVALQLLVNLAVGPVFAPGVLGAWAAAVGVLFAYPFFGLALERAPGRAYAAMFSGPLFVVWRTWLALVSRLGGPVVWIRTAHGEGK